MMHIVLYMLDMSILFEPPLHFHLQEEKPDPGRRQLKAPGSQPDASYDNQEIVPDPDDDEYFIIDHIEPQNAHGVSAVDPASQAVSGVVTACLFGEQFTHGVNEIEATTLFGRNAEVSERHNGNS